MKVGSPFCINLNKTRPDLKNVWTDKEIFPFDEICDFDEWRENSNYMKIVKEEEQKSVNELGIESNFYEMKENHSIVFLAAYESDKDMLTLLKKIPESDMMQVLIIEPHVNVEA